MSRTSITLIRHGETTWNADGRWQGHADVPLSEIGWLQAEQLGTRLVAEEAHFDHIYASDLLRAWDTAAIIGAALNLPVHPLPSLREVHLGVWSGLTTAEIKARYADAWTLVEQGGKRGEHGESDAEFWARTVAAIDLLLQQHPGEHLAVVTHGGTIRAIVDHSLHLLPDTAHKRVHNTSLTTITWDGTHWQLVQFNDHAHLLQPLATSEAL